MSLRLKRILRAKQSRFSLVRSFMMQVGSVDVPENLEESKLQKRVCAMSRMLIGETGKDLGAAMKEWFSIGDHYTTQLETSGWRILECLRNYQYDVIVLDIILPGIDGMTVVRNYRADGGTAPIILMAAGIARGTTAWT